MAGADRDDVRRANIAGVLLGVAFIVVGVLLAVRLGLAGVWRPVFAISFGVLLGLFVRQASLWFGIGSAQLVGAFIAPSGSSTPYQQTFSYQESLAIRGDVAGALRSYEELIAASPGDSQVRVRAAELYIKAGVDVARGAALLREIQRIPQVPATEDVYASNRLVDLYLGPLDNQGKAFVELRRLAELYPSSRAGAEARAALKRLKDEAGQ